MVSRVGNDSGEEQALRPVTMASEKEVQQVEAAARVTEQTKKEAGHEERLPFHKASNMVDSMNTILDSANSQLKFMLHDDLKEYYVAIVDTQTDEVIREIPPKKLMDIFAAMKEFVGLLVDRKI